MSISMWDVRAGDAIVPKEDLWGRALTVIVTSARTDRYRNTRTVEVVDSAGRRDKWWMPAYHSTGERTRHLLPSPYDDGTVLPASNQQLAPDEMSSTSSPGGSK